MFFMQSTKEQLHTAVTNQISTAKKVITPNNELQCNI